MGENICKQCNRSGINLQNTQTVHTTQYLKIPNKKWREDLNRYFFPKKTYRYTTTTWKNAQHHSLIIREMQIKTTMRYHLTVVRMSIIKK